MALKATQTCFQVNSLHSLPQLPCPACHLFSARFLLHCTAMLFALAIIDCCRPVQRSSQQPSPPAAEQQQKQPSGHGHGVAAGPVAEAKPRGGDELKPEGKSGSAEAAGKKGAELKPAK